MYFSFFLEKKYLDSCIKYDQVKTLHHQASPVLCDRCVVMLFVTAFGADTHLHVAGKLPTLILILQTKLN